MKEKEDLLSKANSCVDELLEIIKTGQELADYVEECDKITPIIDRDGTCMFITHYFSYFSIFCCRFWIRKLNEFNN